MVGINSNSKYKEKAFEFIKLLLSENYQSNLNLSGIPVSIKGYTNAVDSYKAAGVRENYETYLGVTIENPVPLSAQVIKNMDEVISSIDTCNIVDRRITEIVSAEVTEYLKNDISEGVIANRINEKVILYLNE